MVPEGTLLCNSQSEYVDFTRPSIGLLTTHTHTHTPLLHNVEVQSL